MGILQDAMTSFFGVPNGYAGELVFYVGMFFLCGLIFIMFFDQIDRIVRWALRIK